LRAALLFGFLADAILAWMATIFLASSLFVTLCTLAVAFCNLALAALSLASIAAFL